MAWKVGPYKGSIRPYKSQAEYKISRKAAMAVGETSGAPGAPRRVVSSSAAARRKPEGAGVPEADAVVEAEPLVKAADPEQIGRASGRKECVSTGRYRGSP